MPPLRAAVRPHTDGWGPLGMYDGANLSHLSSPSVSTVTGTSSSISSGCTVPMGGSQEPLQPGLLPRPQPRPSSSTVMTKHWPPCTVSCPWGHRVGTRVDPETWATAPKGTSGHSRGWGLAGFPGPHVSILSSLPSCTPVQSRGPGPRAATAGTGPGTYHRCPGADSDQSGKSQDWGPCGQ